MHKHKLQELGFTYIGVLIVMASMLIAIGAVSQIWHTQMQREKEVELIFIGGQFRTAIGQFYAASGHHYPMSLNDLLGADGVQNSPKRYLRKMYTDPMTGKADWGVVVQQDGGIYGVYSASNAEPYKVSGFSDINKLFEGKKKYSEWRFIYTPPVQNTGTTNIVNGFVRPLPRSQ